MNTADSDAVRRLLFERGFVESGSHADSGLIVVNTCSVRESAERRALARIAEFAGGKKSRPGQKLWVIGCMAERLGEKLKERIGGIDLVIGAKRMESIEEAVEAQFPIGQVCGGAPINISERAAVTNLEPVLKNDTASMPVTDKDDSAPKPLFRKTPVTDFVTILRGCDNYCAYCVVPYVRGRERSVPYNIIEEQVLEKVGAGAKEITFLGQNVNSYNYDGIDFPQLLYDISEIKGLERIRFTTSHPKDCTEGLIDVMASSPKIASHIHLPVQAGADRVLSLMNRKYTAARYRYLIDMIRKRIPRADITSDILVGFPTETDSEFRETLSLVRDARFTTAFMFAYSPREGTAAAGMKGEIPKKEKLARLSELIALQTEITREIYEKTVGQELEVLITEKQQKRDKAWMGQDKGCKRILISCENLVAGMIFKVKAIRSSGMTLITERV
jgi:tRNA-2-methylthio-N6-dimethylallyladenosine synthase